MEEKEIIRGKIFNVKKLCLVIIIIGLVFGISMTYNSIRKDNSVEMMIYHSELDTDYILTSEVPCYMSIYFLPVLVLSIIIYIAYGKMDIIVTDKRVYGTARFRKRIDLPIYKISVVGTNFLKGIVVGTSAGTIYFKGVMNNIEVHSAISKLINSRQDNNKQEQVNNISNAEELKKYKELLDSGVITQEEFEAKKKQLLNL